MYGPRGSFKSPLNLLEFGVPRATYFSDSSPLSYIVLQTLSNFKYIHTNFLDQDYSRQWDSPAPHKSLETWIISDSLEAHAL